MPQGNAFDTLSFTLALAGKAERSLEFRARTKTEAIRWQQELRGTLTGLMGGFPERCALTPRVFERKDFGRYIRETVIFRSRPGLDVFAYWLLPAETSEDREKGPRKLPCVICLPGHGRGVDSIVGLDAKGKMRPWGAWGEYQNDFALQCVAAGYAVLAVEQMGFGHRRDEAAVARGPEASSCQPAAGAALLLGQTMAAWRVWDAMRAVDYALTRAEADPGRIAVMGISGGGMSALFTAALDERIRAAVVSGYGNSFRDSILSLSHCIDNYIPGILRVAEMSDVAGLITPRALFLESGTEDPLFPVKASRAAFREIRHVYEVFDELKAVGMEVFEGDHRFYGRKAFEFLRRTFTP
jgi:dienelactone hydrolase